VKIGDFCDTLLKGEGLSMHRFSPWTYGMLQAFKHVRTIG